MTNATWNDETGVGKSSNPKDRAATSRLDISLFPQTAIAYGALAMTEGDCKYGGYNYRAVGVSVSTYYSAANRHLMKFYNGEWADEKTCVPHLASALACIAVLIDSSVVGNLVDDRPPVQQMSALLTTLEENVKYLQGLFPNGPNRCTRAALEVRHEEPSIPVRSADRTIDFGSHTDRGAQSIPTT